MSCAKDRDFKKLVQRINRMHKQLDKMHDNLDRNLYRRFSAMEKLIDGNQKRLSKLEKHAYGRLSESTIKADQKRNERELMRFVEDSIRKYDRSKT